MGICESAGILHLSDGGRRQAILEVLSNGTIEQHRLLRDETHLVAKPGHVELFDINALEFHRTNVRIIETLNELDHGGFAPAAHTDESERLPLLDAETETAKDRGFGTSRVCEMDVSESNLGRLDVVPIGSYKTRVALLNDGLLSYGL